MNITVLDHQKVLSMLPDRPNDSHKGTFGKILLLCGSRGFTGAAALAAMGALRSGVGLTYLAVPESIYEIEAVKLTEPVIFPVDDDNGTYSISGVPQIEDLLTGKDAVLVGPGIGRSDGATAVVRTVLESFSGPVVVDADGINVLSAHKDILRGRTSPTILTPHDGEFQRFGGNLTEDRIRSAAEMATQYSCVVLLKGCRTIITDGMRCYCNHTGNPGMATAGAGDVLTGVISAFMAQGYKPEIAAIIGVYIHGLAGDIAVKKTGEYGLIATDIIEHIGKAIATVLNEK